MKTYIGYTPLIATVTVEIEDRNEARVMEKLEELYDTVEIDLMGFDNEPINTWWWRSDGDERD